MKRFLSVLAVGLVMAVVLVPASASAYSVPNLVAVTTPDDLVAITYADTPTPRARLAAGAFTTMMQSYGFIGIPNYDATTTSGSQIVCEMPQKPSGLWVVYGILGQGVSEAVDVCQYMSDEGNYVRWR